MLLSHRQLEEAHKYANYLFGCLRLMLRMFLDPGVFFPQVNLVDSSQEKTHYSVIVNSLIGTRRMQEERKGEACRRQCW